MKALTLTQPWAGLVASGIKLIENRQRAMIKREDFGKPFALHASREIDERVYTRIREIAPDLAIDHGHTFEWRDHGWVGLSRITSAVIAVATIDKAFTAWDSAQIRMYAHELCFSNGERLGPQQARWFFGPVGYALRDVRMLREPIQCRGALGFWTVPEHVRTAINLQLGATFE